MNIYDDQSTEEQKEIEVEKPKRKPRKKSKVKKPKTKTKKVSTQATKKKIPEITPEEFFASIKPVPEYIKHLVACRCILPQFKNMEDPPEHKFVVFSELNDSGDIDPHYAQCNNCGLIHKIFEVGKSQTLKRESLLTLPTINDIKGSLPEWLSGMLSEHDCELHTWQEAEFIYKYKLWGKFIILAKEREESLLLGKALIILGENLYKVETFERDEEDVRP